MPQRKKGKKPPKSVVTDQGHVNPAATSPASNPSPPAIQLGALNPHFDPRMRRIGNPMNKSSRIKRGWIQTLTGDKRVNFLFNPASMNIVHQEDPNAKSDLQAPESVDIMSPDYVSQSSTGVSLLYDRTYELFSQPFTVVEGGNLANTYGVFADIAAWYTFLNMVDEMPKSWSDSFTIRPLNRVPAYLFMGALMPFYGFVSSLNVTYTHWTLNMVPQRAKVDVSFVIMPRNPETMGAMGAGTSALPGTAEYYQYNQAALDAYNEISDALDIFGDN